MRWQQRWICQAELLRRVVRLPVAHDGVDDVAQLPRHGGDGDAVGLALAAQLVVVLLELGVVLPGPIRGQPQRPPQVGRAVLGYRDALGRVLAGLVDAGVEPRVLDDRGGVPEPPDVADLGDDLGAGRGGHAGDGRDVGLDLLEQRRDLLLDLGDRGVQELDLRDHRPDLERGGLLAEPYADRRFRRGLDLRGLGVAEPAARALRQQLGYRRRPLAGDLGGRRAFREHLERRGPEHVGEQPGVLGEVGVEHAYGLGLHGGELLLEPLVVAGELLERLHLVGGQPRLVVVALPERLGDQPRVYAVVLHAGQALELAHGVHLHGVDDADAVARGHEVGEAGLPVVAGGLHADEDVLLGLGDGLQPSYAPLEAGLAVLELHGPCGLGPRLVDGADHVVHLGDVHTCVDHAVSLLLVGGLLLPHPGPLPPRRDPRNGAWPPSSSLSAASPGWGRLPDSFTRSGALITHVGNPARQNLHCIHKHSIKGLKMQRLKDRRQSGEGRPG